MHNVRIPSIQPRRNDGKRGGGKPAGQARKREREREKFVRSTEQLQVMIGRQHSAAGGAAA